MRIRVCLLAVLAGFSSTAVAAPDAKPPTAKWIVDFGDAQCIATRNYGTDSDPLYLVLKAPPLGDVLQIAISRKGYAPEAIQLDGEIVFDDQPPIQTNLLEFGSKQLNQRGVIANLSVTQLAPMQRASSIRIRARDAQMALGSRLAHSSTSTDQRLELTQMPQVLKALESCVSGLRQAWNIQGASGGPSLVKVEPSANLEAIFKSDDYPGQAVMNEQAGALRLAILVDEKGKLADCTVIQTSGVAALDAQSCAVVRQRAKFKPAVGLDGKPAKGSILQSIVWMLR